MKISRRGIEMPASPIRRLVPYAEAAKKEGVHVYHLNIGQPDIHTPDIMMDGYRNTDIKVLAYGHSGGLWEYREKLAEYYNSFNINVTKEEILITTGGSEAIIFAMISTMDYGDEIIIAEPFYTNYNGFAKEAGVKIVPVTSKIEEGFKLPSISELEAKVTDKTKALLLCNPNNPTGYVYTKEELNIIKDFAIKHDLWILSDEVYREFV
ncbi:MAG: aminotransferase class I/II-fold pyridoxal phosphate-dependent enzyme, partial [Calditrichia bacterium]|nr:aminotransferase class I/II-fold pyridoxal phosphate-dependent enzyme [Calditrichia bacterium]